MADTKASAFGVVTTMATTDVLPVITGIGGTPANSIISKANFKTDLALVKADVGLGSVDNTADASKPVSTAQAAADALNLKIASNLSDLASAATARTNLGVPAGSGTSTGTNTGDQTLPTNAAGTDLDTATDITKFATAKAIKDAHNVPSVAPGSSGNLLTSNGTDWTSAAPAGGGGGQTLVTKVVAASGGDYTTLQAALAAASNGWTIWIAPGTYSLAADTTSALTDITIIGSGSNSIIDLAAHVLTLSGIRTTIENVRVNWTSGNSGIIMSGQRARIHHSYLDASGSTRSSSTLYFSTVYAQLTNCTYIQSSSSIGDQIWFNQSRNTIVGNYFDINNLWTASFMSVNGRSVISGNNFFGNNGSGALGTNYFISSASTGSNDIISNNVLSWGGTGGVGIKVASAETTVSGNNTTGCANGGIILAATSTHCAAVGNVCYLQAVTDSGTANTVASNVT